MRNAKLAEAFLSLICDPDRAASTVGDLMEWEPDGNRVSKAVRFWLRVTRIWMSQFAAALIVAPQELLGAALKGLGVGMLATVSIFLSFSFVLDIVMGNQGNQAFDWAAATSVLVSPVVAGLWVAWSAPRREFAAAIVAAVLVVGITWGLGIVLAWQLGAFARYLWFIGDVLYPVFLIRTAWAVRSGKLREIKSITG